MKFTSLAGVGGFLLFLLTIASASLAVPVTIEQVELNDVVLNANSVTRLDVVRGEPFDLRVRIKPTQSLQNVELLAFISGYEHNDREERIQDSVEVFTAEKDVVYVRTLRLYLPHEADRDDYKIRLVISDRFGDETSQTFNILLDSARHGLFITDVLLSPNIVVAGGALLAKVHVDNKGQRRENDVRVTVNIPDLGISGVDYIDEVKAEREDETEEIFLKVPQCARPGVYSGEAVALYTDSRFSVRKPFSVEITENPSCQTVAQVQLSSPVVQIQKSVPSPPAPVRSGLEVALLTLVGLLALLGIALAVSKLGN